MSKEETKHALLSPSRMHWVNYDDERFNIFLENHQRAVLGSRLHAFADEAIKLKRRMPNTNDALNQHVNDAIGYRMDSEVLVYVSENAFGTIDALFCDGKTLRIHDLKTGLHPGNMLQLKIYAAFYCIEQNLDPEDLEIILQIYQGEGVEVNEPSASEIRIIMDRTLYFDSLIKSQKG
jgi:hypothetical protein